MENKSFFSRLLEAIKRIPGAIRRTWKWHKVLSPLAR